MFGGGVPKMPKLGAEVPQLGGGIPKLLGAGSGAGGGGGELDAALKEVEELQGKLREAEEQICTSLKGALPKVEIRLPRLDASMFSAAPPPRPEYQPLVQGVASDAPELQGGRDVPGAGAAASSAQASSAGGKKAAEARAKAEAARKQAEMAAAEMQEQAREAAAAATGRAAAMAATATASATSIVGALAIGALQLGALWGPLIAGLLSCAVSMAGLAYNWLTTTEQVFDLLSRVFGKLTGAVLKVIDTIDDMLEGPLTQLEDSIEGMVEEQRPTVEKMKEFEDVIKKVNPDFDVPDPEDLKKPLDGCEAIIQDIVDKAKKEVPARLDEAVKSTRIGAVATDHAAFSRLLQVAPLALAFAFNASLAVLQVVATYLLSGGAVATTDPTAPGAPMQATARRLRGSGAQDASSSAVGAEYANPSRDELQEQLLACVLPALVQVALGVLQTLAGRMLAQGPRICQLVNKQIASLEVDMSDRVNKRVQGAVDRVFGQAFAEVQGVADEFFPKFADSVEKLKTAMGQAAKLQAAAAALGF